MCSKLTDKCLHKLKSQSKEQKISVWNEFRNITDYRKSIKVKYNEKAEKETKIKDQPLENVKKCVVQDRKAQSQNNFKVYIRCRPLDNNTKEENAKTVIKITKNNIYLWNPITINAESNGNPIDAAKCYEFDHIIDDDTDNKALFNKTIMPFLDDITNGMFFFYDKKNRIQLEYSVLWDNWGW